MTARRILVVDDDSDLRLLSVALLSHLGAEVIEAGQPAEMAEALAQGPDLILLDLVMPGNDYADVVEAISQHPSRIPLLVVSGSESEARERAVRGLRERGIDVRGSLIKPLRLDTLRHTLDTI